MLALDQVHRRARLHHHQNLCRRIRGCKKLQRPLTSSIEHAKILALQPAYEIAAGCQHADADLYHFGGHLQRLLHAARGLLRRNSARNQQRTK